MEPATRHEVTGMQGGRWRGAIIIMCVAEWQLHSRAGIFRQAGISVLINCQARRVVHLVNPKLIAPGCTCKK